MPWVPGVVPSVKLRRMFTLTFLGTGASVPSIERGLSAILVEHGPHRFLVDCGEGTQRQLLRSGAGFRRLDKVLLTHGHIDHILGLAGFAATSKLWGTAERLSIRAGPATLRLARILIRDITWPGAEPPLPIDFIEVAAGPLADFGALRLSAFPVRHRAPECFGFLFEERPRRPVLGDRLAALGVPHGPERGRLARGESITLADGRRIDPEIVLGPPAAGVRLAVIHDAASTDDLVEHVRGADTLVIEATFLDQDRDRARARSHITAAEAAGLAAKAEVRELWLTHLSSRYDPAAILAEARAVFPNSNVASDLHRVLVGTERQGGR